jgi:hypothetical protein
MRQNPTAPNDPESTKAAAELYRLAQATALLRLYRESEGHEAPSTNALSTWLQRHPEISKPIRPTEADHQTVSLARPELAQLANRSNPYLSGAN